MASVADAVMSVAAAADAPAAAAKPVDKSTTDSRAKFADSVTPTAICCAASVTSSKAAVDVPSRPSVAVARARTAVATPRTEDFTAASGSWIPSPNSAAASRMILKLSAARVDDVSSEAAIFSALEPTSAKAADISPRGAAPSASPASASFAAVICSRKSPMSAVSVATTGGRNDSATAAPPDSEVAAMAGVQFTLRLRAQ